MASVRPTASGRWEARYFVGRDPLTRKPRYRSKTIDAEGQREAQRKANGLEVEDRDGDQSGEGGTFGDLCDQWIKVKTRRWSPSTLQMHRLIVDTYLRRPLGDVDVTDIRTHTLDMLYGELTERGGQCQHRPCPRPANCGIPGHPTRCQRVGCVRSWVCPVHDGACKHWTPCEESPCEHGGPLAISTVNRIHVVVRAALEQAVAWGWGGIKRNPAEHADPGTVVTEETEIPEDIDVIQFLAEAEEQDPRLAAYLGLSIESGARRGAMHASRWTYWSGPLCPDHGLMVERSGDGFRCVNCGELDGAISEIRFPKVISIGPDGPVERPATRTKKSGRKKMTLGPHVTAMLVAHHDSMFERALTGGVSMPRDAFMFSDDVAGQVPWYPDSTSRKFRFLRQDINIDSEYQLRSLRDIMATQLLSARVNPRVVMERGGWSRLATMIERYGHVLPADDRAAAGVLDRIYSAEKSDT